MRRETAITLKLILNKFCDKCFHKWNKGDISFRRAIILKQHFSESEQWYKFYLAASKSSIIPIKAINNIIDIISAAGDIGAGDRKPGDNNPVPFAIKWAGLSAHNHRVKA